MARVVLPRNLQAMTAGEAEVILDAPDVRRLFVKLGERYPRLRDHLEHELAVAIDGEIFQDAWLAPIRPDSEVVLVPKIAGG